MLVILTFFLNKISIRIFFLLIRLSNYIFYLNYFFIVILSMDTCFSYYNNKKNLCNMYRACRHLCIPITFWKCFLVLYFLQLDLPKRNFFVNFHYKQSYQCSQIAHIYIKKPSNYISME